MLHIPHICLTMSYQVLARKYRPKSFETLVGQQHVVRALTHALEQKRLHHAYLFTGTRGVGKTTLSRILAKSLNCETGITAHPCGSCDACNAIDAGRFVDYIEMDAASNRGVDEMAQLLEQAVYAPSNARFKVYMIDEVHMLTNHAFNSMLKTLEEPPEHVKFILATTDPQKIPVTVLSRCLQFNLKQMPPGHIIGHLENILGQEGIAFDIAALRLLAQGAQGSMRDALSLTDQAIAYAAGKVTLEAVQSMLGTLDQSYLIRLLDALAARDGAGLLTIADEIASRSLSYNSALQDLGTLLHRIALAQTVASAVPDDLPEREDVMRLAAAFDAEEVQLFYQIVVLGRNELGLAPDEYAGFSMTLLRMLAFRPETGDANNPPSAAGALAGSHAKPASPVPATRANAAVLPAAAATSVSPARAALDAARGVKRPQATPSGSRPASTDSAFTPGTCEVTSLRVEDNPRLSEHLAADSSMWAGEKKTVMTRSAEPAPAPIAMPEAAPRSAMPQPVSELGWDGDWPVLSAALPVRGVVQQLAQQSELIKCEQEGGEPRFHLRVPIETLCSPGNVDKLAAALSEHFGRTIRIRVDVGAVQHTANAQALAERAARQRAAEQAMQNDPFVQTLMREFGAAIVPGSIKPT
jgi:DNA polymerase-3 subunit gamma/tau